MIESKERFAIIDYILTNFYKLGVEQFIINENSPSGNYIKHLYIDIQNRIKVVSKYDVRPIIKNNWEDLKWFKNLIQHVLEPKKQDVYISPVNGEVLFEF